MRKIIVFIITVLMVNASLAQNVGIGTPLPHASAKFEITSTSSGMLIPRMSKAERNLIASPANGLLVFQNAPDSIGFYYYNSGSWIWLQNASGAGSGWSTTGNASTDTSVNFIGTRDNMPLQFKINNQKAGLISVANLGLGHLSLNQLEYGGNNFNNHTAIGNSALTNLKNGILNVGLGSYGLGLLKNGSNNIGLGFQSGSFALGSDNVIIANAGSFTLNEFDSVTNNVIIGNHASTFNLVSDKNVLIGSNAGGSIVNGGSNVAVGDSASASNTTGFSNVAIGTKALTKNTNKSNLVAIGDSALYNNGIGANLSYLGIANTAVGSKSLFGNTTGSTNTALGTNALIENTTGSANTGIGYATLTRNITGSYNTAVGTQAMQGVTSGTAESNVAVGVASLFWIKNGNKNTAIGVYSLQNNTDGSNNVAVGDSSMFKNTTGYSNVAIGAKALLKNINNNNLVAIGDSALFNSGSAGSGFGKYNTAVGSKALFIMDGADANTAVGYNALKQTTGARNTAIGSFAGTFVNGSSNIIIGSRNGLTTGARNIDGAILIGNEAGESEITSNKLYIENSNANKDNALIYGDFAADSINLNAKVNIRDFTRLGTQASGAPAIKMKKIIIPAGPAVDAVGNYAFGGGITNSKILGINVLMNYDAGTSKIPPSYKDAAGYEYNIQVQFDGVTIINKVGNSINIGGKPITVLITYEE